MKLKLIAAAAMVGLAGVAQAQSSVTLYGIMDSGVLYQSSSAATFAPNAQNLGQGISASRTAASTRASGVSGALRISAAATRSTSSCKARSTVAPASSGFPIRPGNGESSTSSRRLVSPGRSARSTAGRQIVPMIYAMADTDVRSAQYFGSILTAWLGMNTAAGWPGNSTNAPIGALYDSNAIWCINRRVFGGVSLATRIRARRRSREASRVVRVSRRC